MKRIEEFFSEFESENRLLSTKFVCVFKVIEIKIGKVRVKMNLHSERAELLSTSLMNLGQSRSSSAATATTLQSLHTSEDKDSIYTFSNDESDFMENSKFGSRLNATAMNTTFSSTTDKNLNDTRNFALKESIRTYSKKKASSSVSPRNDRKRTPTSATNYSDTPSCSPLQSMSSIALSPFSDESNSQTLKSNGSAQTGKPNT